MKFKSNRKEVVAKLTASQVAAVESIGQYVRGKAVDYSPVDTGNLKSSNDYRTRDTSVTIGNSAEYAGYVEMGTRKMASQPYLTPAVTRNMDEISNIIKGELKGW